MRLEACRILTAWLQDVTYGANAKLALLTLDGSDVRPTAMATITDETQNNSVALGRVDGLTLPALVVTHRETTFRDSELPQSDVRADGYVTLRVRYALREAGAATAVVDGAYVMRAVIASLRELHKPDNAASRQRNSIGLISCEELRQLTMSEVVEDTWYTEAVDVRYYAADLKGLGV